MAVNRERKKPKLKEVKRLRRRLVIGVLVIGMMMFVACGNTPQTGLSNTEEVQKTSGNVKTEQDSKNDEEMSGSTLFTRNTAISDVITDPVFGDYGRLIFPVDEGYYSGNTLENLGLTWYSYIDPDKTVEIVNYMKTHAEAGEPVFYDIYTEEEKAADPAKKDTGLFFFKGSPGEKFAICNAGGGFAYVGAMHDSFPHALELSKQGYNAFALIYRPGAQTACEDLARAICFVFEHAEELQIDTDCYSLWGGSAGARMAAWLGSYGTESFGEMASPRFWTWGRDSCGRLAGQCNCILGKADVKQDMKKKRMIIAGVAVVLVAVIAVMDCRGNRRRIIPYCSGGILRRGL